MNEAIDIVMGLLAILFVIIWMYQGARVANIAFNGVVTDDIDNIPDDSLIVLLVLTVIIAVAWPGALALHMIQNEDGLKVSDNESKLPRISQPVYYNDEGQLVYEDGERVINNE